MFSHGEMLFTLKIVSVDYRDGRFLICGFQQVYCILLVVKNFEYELPKAKCF